MLMLHGGSNKINMLWLSDAVWRHKMWSKLLQVMAGCLMAQRHHLGQYWLIINEVNLHSPESNFAGKQVIYAGYDFDNYQFKIAHTSHGGYWVNIFVAGMMSFACPVLLGRVWLSMSTCIKLVWKTVTSDLCVCCFNLSVRAQSHIGSKSGKTCCPHTWSFHNLKGNFVEKLFWI